VKVPRSSGILLHLGSLPGGKLGRPAYDFVDWLADAAQQWWALLPLGPPDWAGSPYASSSAFAAWPGYLERPRAPVSAAELEDFVARHPFWTAHWAAFAGDEAIAHQVRFEREWSALRTYARDRGVRIFGDVPIYVAAGSADVRAHPELFQRGVVAGAPPDAFSSTGQLWGNPLYDWGAVRAQGYRWWIERLRRTFQLSDLARLDHFRGFVAYWAVPEGHVTAKAGRWRRGPGAEVFRAAERELGPLALVAEDLGVITPAVYRLRDRLGYPGMVVLEFGFEGKPSNPHHPSNHSRDQVVYIGTHDHEPALGWWRRIGKGERARVGIPGREPHWELIELALASRAELAVVQAQDVLGLGNEAQLNRPGTAEGNWRWRLRRGQLTKAHAERLRALTIDTGRAGKG
jgi:4-alpha-glucanotransferase